MPFPVAETQFTEQAGAFSPDLRWIAYSTNETGETNVYVQPFGRPGGKYRISPNGGRSPRWRADGKELFYLDASGAMTAVPIEVTDTVVAGSPKTLFPIGALGILSRPYAVTKDGQRFLVQARPPAAASPIPLTVVINWTSTLKK
jgi:eukaryotic-like serine/threonine-protein kinase